MPQPKHINCPGCGEVTYEVSVAGRGKVLMSDQLFEVFLPDANNASVAAISFGYMRHARACIAATGGTSAGAPDVADQDDLSY